MIAHCIGSSSHSSHVARACVILLWALLLISSTPPPSSSSLWSPCSSYCLTTSTLVDKYPAHFRWGPWHPGREREPPTQKEPLETQHRLVCPSRRCWSNQFQIFRDHSGSRRRDQSTPSAGIVYSKWSFVRHGPISSFTVNCEFVVSRRPGSMNGHNRAGVHRNTSVAALCTRNNHLLTRLVGTAIVRMGESSTTCMWTKVSNSLM